jgi:solute carrier family 8 (sodium/calcium exchanger)
MHWCAESTPSGDSGVMLAKWLSVTNHIINKHTNHHLTYKECESYMKCVHGIIPNNEQRAWFKPGDDFNFITITHYFNPL